MASRFFSTNPFRLYGKMASWGFGFTFTTNMIGSTVNLQPSLRISEHPDIFGVALLAKSLQNGALWFTIPYKIIQNPQKSNFCGF